MIATNFGMDFATLELAVLACVGGREIDKATERVLAYDRLRPAILHGGKVQWCWSRRFQEWRLLLLYYKVTTIQQLLPQVLRLAILFYNSGFASPERGMHKCIWLESKKH